MPKVTLSDVTSSYSSTATLNSNFDTIETAFDNTLSRDGSTPNSMGANLDMNSYKIINYSDADPTATGDLITKGYLDSQIALTVLDADFSADGFMVRTDPATYTNVTFQGGSGVTVSNGDGQTGATVTISVGQGVAPSDSPSFDNLVITGNGTYEKIQSIADLDLSLYGAGQALTLNAAKDGFELTTPAGGGDVLRDGNETITGQWTFSTTPIGAGPADASELDITDSGGLYTGTTVEAALSEIGNTFEDPSASTQITLGSTVKINKASGFTDFYRAVRPFAFSDLIDHVYKDDPDLVLLRRGEAIYGQVATPTTHTAPTGFDIYYEGRGNFATTVDRKEDYRNQYIPPYTKVYYLDNVDGNNSNTGLSLSAAKATFSNLRSVINADGGTDYLIYIVNKGKAYDQTDGLTHSNLISKNVAYIGISDADGNKPIIGNLYPASSFSFSANSTYPQVYESSSSSAAQAGRTFDIDRLDSYVDTLGREIKVPTEYVAKTSLADVAATPGSYWLDTSGSMYYIHTLTGNSPTIGTEIIVHRSIIESYLVAGGYGAYIENILGVGGILGGVSNQSFCYFNECISLGSRGNGFYQNEIRNFGTRNCISINPAADGFNYHNIGVTVSGITQANPAVVTANNHGRENGDTVVLHSVNGMTEVNWQVYTVANKTTNTFELSGVDSTSFSAYTSGGKVGMSNPTFHAINPTAIFSGTSDGSNQSSSAHEDCEGWTINPLFVGPYRDHITDIDESKHCCLGGRLKTTRIPASAGSDNTMVQATDNADVALMAVEYGGYVDKSTLFSANSGTPLRIMDMDLPFDSTKYTNVTSTW